MSFSARATAKVLMSVPPIASMLSRTFFVLSSISSDRRTSSHDNVSWLVDPLALDRLFSFCIRWLVILPLQKCIWWIGMISPYKNRYVLHVCHIYNAFIATHVHIALVRKM